MQVILQRDFDLAESANKEKGGVYNSNSSSDGALDMFRLWVLFAVAIPVNGLPPREGKQARSIFFIGAWGGSRLY